VVEKEIDFSTSRRASFKPECRYGNNPHSIIRRRSQGLKSQATNPSIQANRGGKFALHLLHQLMLEASALEGTRVHPQNPPQTRSFC
jgi:hypothetical protein